MVSYEPLMLASYELLSGFGFLYNYNMAVQNNVIIAPINTEDVRKVLSEVNNDISTLCTSARINMWAKNKPVKVATPKGLTGTQRLHAFYGLVAQSVDLQYPSGANNATIFQKAKDGDFGWSYDKPTGGAQAPFRLGDFKGYNHNCVNPFYLEAVDTNLKAQVNIGCLPTSQLPAGNLTAADISVITGFESATKVGYGFLYTKNSGSVVMVDAIDDSGNPLYPVVDSSGNIAQYTVDVSSETGTYEVAAYLVSTFQSLYYLLPVATVQCKVYTVRKISSIVLTVDNTATKLKIHVVITANSDYVNNNTIPPTQIQLMVYRNKGDFPEIYENITTQQMDSTNGYSIHDVSLDGNRTDYHYAKVTFLDCTGEVEW